MFCCILIYNKNNQLLKPKRTPLTTETMHAFVAMKVINNIVSYQIDWR
jgi:hypothetical protein